MTKKEKVRVRIAPSPTGPFHIGTARTALFNFLYAKKNGGDFILRIEDTDKIRSQKHFEKNIIESLDWLGLKQDEGPIVGGKHGPYRQSERTEIYKKYLKKLLESGSAFYCFEEQKMGVEKTKGFREVHFSKDRNTPLKEAEKRVKAGESYVIRFKCPEKEIIIFGDLIRGKIEVNTETIGDFSIAKNFNEPLYNFAAVIDDQEMEISHVIRGEDHISNTPKQILLQRALGFNVPKYAHLPLILGPDKTKLSKRHNSVSLEDYENDGYLSEAMINFMVFLGWNPGTEEEIFDLAGMIDRFSIKKVHLAGAVFNLNKLDWINGHYIRNFPLKTIVGLSKRYFKEELNKKMFERVIDVSRGRLKKLSDLPRDTKFFFEKPDFDISILAWKDMKEIEIKKSLEQSLVVFTKLKDADFTVSKLEVILLKEAKSFNDDRGRLLWPLRAVLTGVSASPSPFEVASILGKKESIKRIKQGISKLNK
jgi:glutamyl-tRNA synthetase